MIKRPASLLSVRNLSTQFRTSSGPVEVVDDVSFDLGYGEVLSIVGESGSGKSVTALSIMGLIDTAVGKITSGEVIFDGRDLRGLSRKEFRKLKGSEMAMIFQEPMSALNPVFSIGDQIAEPLIVRGWSKKAAHDRAIELLDKVRIPSPKQRVNEFPHQLSGGMRQRAMIAMALVGDPKLLIADEPTTALDVTIQAQLLELLHRLREENNMAMILITHDLGVVAGYADRAVVMYCGRVAEEASVKELFAHPRHPYTKGLLECIPPLGGPQGELKAIPGFVPSAADWGEGCRFAARCSFKRPACTAARPPMSDVGAAHQAACVLVPEGVMP